MDRHADAPRPGSSGGRVVLSRLPRGRSAIGAPAPSLKIVLEGEECYEVDGRKHHVRPGQFLYLDAGTDCTAHLREASHGLCLLLPPEITPDAANPLIGRAMTFSARTSHVGALLVDYATRIARDPGRGERLAGELVVQAARYIASPLADMREAIGRLQSSSPRTRAATYERLERARGYLHEHPAGRPSLATVAQVAGISQFQFVRYFKLAYGQPPIAYHRSLWLARAADLLERGEMPLQQVGEACGYADQVAFTHAFTKAFGLAPGAWRRGGGIRPPALRH